MKRLAMWLLRKYSKTEKDRLEIYQILQEQVEETYREQTVYGNVYNANVEFIMANNFVRKCVKLKDSTSINMLQRGLANSFLEATVFIKNENLTYKKNETKN